MEEGSIEARIKLLDQLAQKGLDSDVEDINTAVLSRDGLTDVLLALYSECSKLRFTGSKHIAAFVKKCKFTGFFCCNL